MDAIKYNTIYSRTTLSSPSEKLLKKTADVTRSTVQKSVCVLSRLPLYGLIKAKLELITHAYFDERDFSKVDLLEETFNNLCQSMTDHLVDSSQVFLGLSAREVVLRFQHKIVVLFKLLLLERKVLFFGSPVELLSSTLLSVLSLYPCMIEFGLEECSVPQSREVSPTLEMTSPWSNGEDDSEGFLEVRYSSNKGGKNSEPQSPSIPRDGSCPQDYQHCSPPSTQDGHNTETTKKWHCDRMEQVDHHARVHDVARIHSLLKGRDVGSQRPACDDEHDEHEAYSEFGSLKDKEEIVLCKADSPLQHVAGITQIEAVQMEEYSHKGELQSPEHPDTEVKAHLSLSLDEKDPLFSLLAADSFEDLDSPESISRIDREDCFSWEDDRVLLAIDHEAEEASGENIATGSTGTVPNVEDRSSSRSVLTSEKGSPTSRTSPEHSGRRHSSASKASTTLKNKLTTAFGSIHVKGSSKASSPIEMKTMSREAAFIQQDDFGCPLTIFTKGNVCHPYLSLQYHDILHDVNVRGFVIGATNILFKQRRTLVDVIVEANDGVVEILDKELQKQVHLTTADLRFADYLVKMVIGEQNNIYLDGTEWEGGDEWIRAQFRLYLQSLLSTMTKEDPKLIDDFGLSFIQAWKTTQNFKFWCKSDHPGLKDIPQGHPYQGHLNIADIRVRLSHSLQNSERGKKINAAVVQTGKYVAQTGRAVGGAISNARSALSSWFSGFGSEKLATSQSQNPQATP